MQMYFQLLLRSTFFKKDLENKGKFPPEFSENFN